MLQTKLQKAMRCLYAQKDMTIPDGRKLDEMLDKLDFAVRTLMCMLRQLKCSEMSGHTPGFWAMLSEKETFALKSVLAKVKLPFSRSATFADLGDEEESGVDDTPEPMPLALIEHAKTPSAHDHVCSTGSIFYDVAQQIRHRYQHVHDDVEPTNPVPAPGSPLVPKSSHRHTRRRRCLAYNRPKVSKEEVPKEEVPKEEVPKEEVPQNDADLLASAEMFVAKPKVKTKAKAKGKAKFKAKANAKTKKVGAGVGVSTTAKDVIIVEFVR